MDAWMNDLVDGCVYVLCVCLYVCRMLRMYGCECVRVIRWLPCGEELRSWVYKQGVAERSGAAPNQAIQLRWMQSLTKSLYMLFKGWLAIAWWRPAEPRTRNYFTIDQFWKQSVLVLTGAQPRKPHGVDFVAIIEFQFGVAYLLYISINMTAFEYTSEYVSCHILCLYM